MSSYCGIDFGTTNTALVYYSDDSDERSYVGEKGTNDPMPSLVSINIKTGETCVGKQVKDNFTTLNETIYGGMTVTVLPSKLDSPELNYRVNNGDGNEDVWVTEYNAQALGFDVGEMFDDKYHLFKHKSSEGVNIDTLLADLNPWTVSNEWVESDINRHQFPKPSKFKNGSIVCCTSAGELVDWSDDRQQWYFLPSEATETTCPLWRWLGYSPYILIAKTQNNCYAISKPFCKTTPLVYKINMILSKHGMYVRGWENDIPRVNKDNR